MLVSLLFISLLTIGGFGLTYLFAGDETLLRRFSAGNVVGSTVFGTICFLLACFFGFNAGTILFSLLITLSPLILFGKKDLRERFSVDWSKAKTNLAGADFDKLLLFFYYFFFFVLLWFFFDRAMLVKPDGIYTGGSQNLGDLPFHLGAIFSFTEGNNFPPENPSFAFAKFTYPFITDLITASFVKFGANAREAMLLQNVFLGFSLVVLLERFTFKLTGNRLAGKLAPPILLFCGGLGFVWFLNDYRHQVQGFFDFLLKLPRDYTIGEKFRWGNALVTLFMTQRSLLLGMPLTLIVLQKLWQTFSNAECGMRNAELKTEDQSPKSKVQSPKSKVQITNPHSAFRTSHLIVGLLAGTLALVHVHSLAVLFVVSAFLFFFSLEKWREWIAFGVGAAVIAVPELVWSLTGSATRLTEFVDWNFGWDKGDANFFVFWSKNLGLFIPLLIAGTYLIFSQQRHGDAETRQNQKTKDTEQRTKLLLFYIPFAFLFVVSNAVKLAPWQWDNIKVLIYWFVGSIPLVALVLAKLLNAKGEMRNAKLKAKDQITKPKVQSPKPKTQSAIRNPQSAILWLLGAACFALLIFSGALDVWRVASGQINYQVFDKDAVNIAAQIKQTTAPNALFLNAPTYNSAVVLSGRRSLMRYVGHLSSYGIDYGGREADLKRIYAGDATSQIFLDKYKIEYVLISPEEKNSLTVNEEFFRKFPVVAEAGQYRVYKTGN